jgi:hypothetical protein
MFPILLKSITDIFSGKEIKVKKNNLLSEEHIINQGVRQGCPLSLRLVNIYINEIIVKWNL